MRQKVEISQNRGLEDSNNEDGSGTESNNLESMVSASLGWRHVQAYLLFFGLSCAYLLRTNLSVAIVAMVNTDESSGDFETFNWDSSAQSYVLSSFFWGYIMTQILGGQLAERWSAKKLLAIAVTVSGIFAILNPLAATLGGWKLLCACRVLMGVFQGCVFPSLHTLLGKWSPLNERAVLAMVVYAGMQFGTIVSMPITGLLSASSAGWPSGFYIFGGLSVVWGIVWFFVGAESPATHPWISSQERKYIEASLKTVDGEKTLPTPWRAILTSNVVWALAFSNCGYLWGSWMLLTGTPTYLKGVLGFAIAANGFVAAFPYFGKWVFGYPMSYIADFILKRGYVSVGTSRKLCNTIGCWVPAALLVVLSYMDKDQQMLAVVVLVLAVSCNAGCICGYLVNVVDVSPNFAGTMFGLMNTLGNMFSLAAPLVQGYIVTDSTDTTQWRTLFFVGASMYFLTNLCYLIFGTGETQRWNDPLGDESTELKSTSSSSAVSTEKCNLRSSKY